MNTAHKCTEKYILSTQMHKHGEIIKEEFAQSNHIPPENEKRPQLDFSSMFRIITYKLRTCTCIIK
jgi:hypothetical protein